MQKTRGFTLIEILVALAIIATIFAAVSFSTRNTDWMKVQDDSENFRDALIDMSDHASFRQTSYGLYFTEFGYWWLERVEVYTEVDEYSFDEVEPEIEYAWAPIQNTRFESQEFEDQYIFEVLIDDNPITLLANFPNEYETLEVGLTEIEDNEIFVDSFNSSADDNETGILPHVYIDLNGELSNAFTLKIIQDLGNIEEEPITFEIKSDGYNRPIISRVEEF